MEKHTVHVDMKIHADAKEFLEKLLEAADKCGEGYVSSADAWRKQCVAWKKKYPVVSEGQLHTGDNKVNVYGFMKALSAQLPKGSLTAVSNGACCVAGHQSWVIKEGTRFIINNAVASM